MLTSNYSIIIQAKDLLLKQWKPAVCISVIQIIFQGILTQIKTFGSLLSLLLSGPIAYGHAVFYLNVLEKKGYVRDYFSGFTDTDITVRALKLYAYMIFQLFIRYLLFIIPGVIATYSYSMSFFIFAENPTLSHKEVLEKSKTMMEGNRLKLLYLGLRSSLYFVVGIIAITTVVIIDVLIFPSTAFVLTLLIPLMFVVIVLYAPFISICTTLFYKDLVNSQKEIG